MDPRGHGTMVGGIIAARGNNTRGTAGVIFAGGPSLVGCKLAENLNNVAFANNAYDCLRFCQAVPADITVMSWGLNADAAFDNVLFNMLLNYNTALHVVAIGNDGARFFPGNANAVVEATSQVIPPVPGGVYRYDRNAPGSPAGHAQPAAYSGVLPHVISVGAVNLDGNDKWDFSNYGNEFVDVWAPGVDVVTTISCASKMWYYPNDNPAVCMGDEDGCFPYPATCRGDEVYTYNQTRCIQTAAQALNDLSNSYFKDSGTSFSAPFVAGVAAAVKNAAIASGRRASPADLKNILMRSACSIAQLQGLGRSGMVNMYEAVRMAQTGIAPNCIAADG